MNAYLAWRASLPSTGSVTRISHWAVRGGIIHLVRIRSLSAH